MKVLYVVHANIWDEFSGTPLIADQYAKEIFKRGWEACILTPSFKNLDFENQKIKKINNISYLSWPGLKNWNLDAFKNLSLDNVPNYNIPFKPDLIHILDWININPSILEKLKYFNVPILKHVWNFEDFCYFISPIYKEKNNNICKAPLSISSCSNCIEKENFKKLKFLKRIKYFLLNSKKKIIKNLENKLNSRHKAVQYQTQNYYDHLIFPTKSFAKYYFSHLKFENEYSIISHGIDVRLNSKKKELNKSIKCIYTGGATTRKGWKIVEDVISNICSDKSLNIKFRIYGDKNKTRKSKLKKFSNIEFYDSFDPKDIDNVMQWADIGIAPSFFETYSRIVREYLNFNVIPIASDVFGVSDIIEDNINGILIQKPYFENLFLALKKVINNPQILNQLRQGIKKTSIISKEDEFNEIFDLYKKLIK